MPSRPDPASLMEREKPRGQGRDAVFGAENGAQTPTASTAVIPAPALAGWEARHKRVTFHCPLELLDALEHEVKVSGRKKNTVIVDALRTALTSTSTSTSTAT